MSKLEGIIGGTCIALGTLGFALFGGKLNNKAWSVDAPAGPGSAYTASHDDETITITPDYQIIDGEQYLAGYDITISDGDNLAPYRARIVAFPEDTPTERARRARQTRDQFLNLLYRVQDLREHDIARDIQHYGSPRKDPFGIDDVVDIIEEMDPANGNISQDRIKHYRKSHSLR